MVWLTWRIITSFNQSVGACLPATINCSTNINILWRLHFSWTLKTCITSNAWSVRKATRKPLLIFTLANQQFHKQLSDWSVISKWRYSFVKQKPRRSSWHRAANDIINNWQHVNESISHLRQHTLRFGIEPSVSEHYLPALTKPIIEQDLLSSVHTVEMGANQLVKQVLAGQLDLAISGNLDQTLDERLAVTPLRPFKFRILANPDHPLAKSDHPTFAEALKSPFVLLNATYLNKLVFRQLAEQLSIEPQVLFESDSSTLIKGLVKENLALGFISDITTPAEGEDDDLVEIPFDDVQVPSVHINLIRRAHQFPIGLVKQVIDIIEKTFADDNAKQENKQ